MTNQNRHSISPLTLGTAALGLRYGLANPRRVPSGDEVAEILDGAWRAGIHCFDTAPAYGLAEERIGQWRTRTGNPVTIATKLPSLRDVPDREVGGAIEAALAASLAKLEADQVAYYLVHDATDWLRATVREMLLELRADSRILACGVSAYSPNEISAVLAAGGVDAVQVPVNLFNQGFAESGTLRECGKARVTVFARSLFLQGLIFRKPNTLNGFFSPFAKPVAALQNLAKEEGLGLAELAVRHARGIVGIDSMVVGIHNISQLAKLVEASKAPALNPDLRARINEISYGLPSALTDPRGWPN